MYTKFHEIELDQPTWTVALLTLVEQKETKSKQPFCVFTLQDGEKTIQANIWNTQKENVKLEQGLIYVQLYKEIYNGTESWEVKAYDAAPLDAKMEDYIITAPIPSDRMFQEIQTILTKEIGNTGLFRLTMDFLNKNQEKLLYWSAAKRIHHNCYGGLLYHIYQMLKTGVILSRVYSFNKEILYTAIVLHDIGKLQELETDAIGASDYTVDGILFGHTMLAIEWIDRMAAEATAAGLPYDQEKIRLLKHCIASHHGNLEYGAVVMPAIKEAMFLHEIDMIDSRFYQYEQIEKGLEPGQMSERIFGLDSRVYKAKI